MAKGNDSPGRGASKIRLAWRKADQSLDIEGHGLAVSLVIVAVIVLIAITVIY